MFVQFKSIRKKIILIVRKHDFISYIYMVQHYTIDFTINKFYIIYIYNS